MDKVKKSALVRSVLTPLDEFHLLDLRRVLTFFSNGSNSSISEEQM